MQRKLTDDLVSWLNKPKRKPLIIQGARQVGKTWLMKSFGENYFEAYVYINFESKNRLKSIFSDDFNLERIFSILEIETSVKITEKTLLIFDEIQEAEKSLTALKYFYENKPEIPVIAAGSYLGVSLQKEVSFPVGKVDLLHLMPLSFEEFLLNVGELKLLEQIKLANWEIIEPFHEKLTNYIRQYYFVGGMPEVVSSFIEEKDYKLVRTLQQHIIEGYQNDFAKHAPINDVPKILLVWQNILSQLAKENKKFIYGQIKKGARAKGFETAINWLEKSGLLLKSHRINTPKLPLQAYQDYDSFKLFMLDVGLLNCLAGISEKILLNKNQILTELKGAMTEQFVAQQLALKYPLFYWAAERGTAEIDFLISDEQGVIPIEVKAEENLKAKSLSVFVEKYRSEKRYRASMSKYRKSDLLENIPLYALTYFL
jgi:predicted AAA+ superfamily ATPase